MTADQIRRSSAARWRDVDGRCVVFSPATLEVHALDEAAAAVWTRLDGVRTTEQIATEIESAFQVTTPFLEREVRELLEQFIDIGIAESDVQPKSVEEIAAWEAAPTSDAYRRDPPEP